ncbi:phenylacetaldehyde reductase-like isoform X2 [Carya illinoinensis]|uniref:phenylacetaldehyde reductase-like isoform X2 n=1 Tax=Carya illinoinensis TaxID=32201 RepID=UPI001C71EF0B|nr:phenylacetaldehyde reductase-like isoform X2 [Carya illinoinensis]
MSVGAEKVVCVTGASGYIASWLVKLLLQRGYTVNASVRDPNDPKKTEHLLMLDGAKERLHLFKADILEEGSFDSLVDGCEGVFHTASPVYLSANDPQAELIEPAVKGTLNVLRSCAKVSSVKRVVITSSMAAVVYNGKPHTPDVLVDETWFSDPAFCEESKLWYTLSKTLAEKAAWEFSKENGIDMIAMHPGWVSGPLLQPTINTSLKPFLKLAKGEPDYKSTNATAQELPRTQMTDIVLTSNTLKEESKRSISIRDGMVPPTSRRRNMGDNYYEQTVQYHIPTLKLNKQTNPQNKKPTKNNQTMSTT